jgi:hypothetical protein
MGIGARKCRATYLRCLLGVSGLMLKDGWNIISREPVEHHGVFETVGDCLPQAKIIRKILNKPVVFILFLDGHIHELVEF